MTTFNEHAQRYAQRYAQRILEAIAKDRFSTYTKITASALYASKTIQEIKSVKRDIDALVYPETRKPSSESDKRRIIVEIQKELNVPTQRQMESIFETASNDDLSDLADEVENILIRR
jgi:hypothetical protein